MQNTISNRKHQKLELLMNDITTYINTPLEWEPVQIWNPKNRRTG